MNEANTLADVIGHDPEAAPAFPRDPQCPAPVSLRERVANYVISGATGARVVDDRLGDFNEDLTVTAGELRNLVLHAFDLATQAPGGVPERHENGDGR